VAAAGADADADADTDTDHRARAADLELDQMGAAVEAQAREAQREHYGAVVARYRELCGDTPMDARGRDFFKQVLLGMLADPAPEAPARPRHAGPGNRHALRLVGLELEQFRVATERRAREAQREHCGRVTEWYRELCEDTAMDERGKVLFKEALVGMLAAPGRAGAGRRAREAWRRGVDESLAD
jgi:hypothetical protein